MRSPLLLSSIAVSLVCNAQWSTDPAAPMPVCNAADAQTHMQAIADADSGYFVFWSDRRNNPDKADLYGQHFDSDGHALWTANGELLLSNPTRSINHIAPVLMPDGSVIVSFLTGANPNGSDTVRAMRFTENAEAMWTEPVLLIPGLDHRMLKVIRSADCAYVVSYCEACAGGGYGCRMQRVRMDGTVQFALPGLAMGSTYYGPYTLHPDGAGGLLFSIRCGNGAGTCLQAQRFDSLGTPAWPNYIELADQDGLNYAFATSTDAEGAFTAAWEVNGDLRMMRRDTLGAPLWSPSVLPACALPVHSQGDPSVLTIGNEIFVAWADNRPPASNYDLYLQKFDLSTGTALWAADGVPSIQINTYLPRTGLVASDNGGVVVTYDGNVDGYTAMRVNNDGTTAWPAPAVMCTPNFNPFYERRVHLSDGAGGVVAFWESFAGDLYGARVLRTGMLYDNTALAEATHATGINIFPNPAEDILFLDLPFEHIVLRAELINSQGRSVPAVINGRSIDLNGIAPGAYIVRIQTDRSVRVARFTKHR